MYNIFGDNADNCYTIGHFPFNNLLRNTCDIFDDYCVYIVIKCSYLFAQNMPAR